MRVLIAAVAALALSGCESLQQSWRESLQPRAAEPAATNTTSGEPTPLFGASDPAPSAAAAPGAPAPTLEQQLLEAERLLSVSAQQRGLGGALAGAIDPVDGYVIRPGVVYKGAEEVARGIGVGAAAGAPIYWQPDRVFVSRSGDLGTTSGRYVQVVAGAEAMQGRYVIVWRRSAAGEWLVLTETRTQDPPRVATTTRRRR